jgi:hypothetical protein
MKQQQEQQLSGTIGVIRRSSWVSRHLQMQVLLHH